MSTNAYLVICDQSPEDKGFRKLLGKSGFEPEEVRIGSNHGAIAGLLKDREPGIVFIPAAWQDMFCVKILNEIEILGLPFETAIFGPQPEMAGLIAAFNAGLSAFIETPVNADGFAQILSRLKTKLAARVEKARDLYRLREYDGGTAFAGFSPQMVERDQVLAKAFMDIVNRTGPIFDDKTAVLLVSSSQVQQSVFEIFLKALGVTVLIAGSVAEAMTALGSRAGCRMIISDSILPDGDARALVEKVRKAFTSELPRVVVITASPDKVAGLLSPDSHIDDVIIKPAPDVGMESILPTVISGLYQTR